MSHSYAGTCPICGNKAKFTATDSWYRDGLHCDHCGSIPRERAFSWVLEREAPDWRSLVLHECSPADRIVSTRLRDECPGYIGTQFYRNIAPGTMHNGFRCENLEQLTFADESIDLHCHLDVMEHVNFPEHCFAEMERTLRPGGKMIFTTPVYAGKVATERRAYYDEQGKVNFLVEPEYHGNPIDELGAPVVFHFGKDLADMILLWAKNCSVKVIDLNDPRLGVLGLFREVFVVTKYGPEAL